MKTNDYNRNNDNLQYEWYFEEEEGSPPAEPPGAEPPAPASRDLLIHNVKKIEGNINKNINH